jgi:hypothetical protein
MKQRIDSHKSSGIAPRSNLPLAAETNMLKAQFLKDMELAGLAATSRKTYLDAVEHKVLRFALRFFFGETLGRDWHLFKKKCGRYLSSVCPRFWSILTVCS